MQHALQKLKAITGDSTGQQQKEDTSGLNLGNTKQDITMMMLEARG